MYLEHMKLYACMCAIPNENNNNSNNASMQDNGTWITQEVLN